MKIRKDKIRVWFECLILLTEFILLKITPYWTRSKITSCTAGSNLSATIFCRLRLGVTAKDILNISVTNNFYPTFMFDAVFVNAVTIYIFVGLQLHIKLGFYAYFCLWPQLSSLSCCTAPESSIAKSQTKTSTEQ